MKSLKIAMILALVLIAGSVFAAGQSSDNYSIPNDVLSGGGSHSSSTNYNNDSTLGQSSPLGDASGTSYLNYPGFWQADECVEDRDYDGLANCYEYYYGLDPDDDDWDDDGLLDGEEIAWETDPKDADTDDDGLSDGDEVTSYGTDPNDPDTDDDLMPDGWEVDNSLNPTVTDSETADGDSDTIENVHEYFNGTRADTENPVCGAGGHCVGDSGGQGTADGDILGNDLSQVMAQISGGSMNYGWIIPDNGESADLNASLDIEGGDLSIYNSLISGADMGVLSGAAYSMEDVLPVGSSVIGGSTIEINLLSSVGTGENPRPSYGVIFWVDSSSIGEGALYGGEGSGVSEGFPEGSRYDVSNSISEDGSARVWLKVISSGTLQINVKVPQTTKSVNKFLLPVPEEGNHEIVLTVSPE